MYCFGWSPSTISVIFQSRAVQYEIGQPSNPLTVAWLSGHPPTSTVGDKWTEHVSSDQASHPQAQVLVHLSFLPSSNENIRENVHQVGSILFETNFIITQLAMFDLLLRFDHHRQPSSGTECSVVTAR